VWGRSEQHASFTFVVDMSTICIET
jgi:hypothetical protein